MKDIGSGRFGIEIDDPGKRKPYKLWYKYEADREAAFARLRTNKKLSISKINR